MNCHCQPGQLAVKRVSNKNNQNRGKEFYVCPTQSCNFFLWADSKVPVTLHARVPPSSSSSFRPNSSSSSSISNNYGRTNAQQSAPPSNLPTAKMTLVAIENNTAYVGLTCQYNVSINNFMQKHHDCCKFDYSRKLWTFDLKIYDSVVQLLRDAGYQPEELPRFLSDGIRKYFAKVQRPSPASSSSSSSSHQVYGMQNQEKERNGELLNQPSDIKLNISSSLSSILLPFQVEGVKFIINHCGRGLIGDEMGCGKTIQAIALLQHYRAHWPAIVLIPTNLMVQWKEELLKYCHDCLSSQDICCVKTGKDHLYGKITIIPYSLIGQFVDRQELLSERFGMIIADESHKLKNSDSKTASYVVPLLKTIPIAICLSGTPMMNRPVELYTQLNGLQPTIFYDYHGFLFRYCDAKQDSLGFLDKKGASNENELKLLLETFIMIRRLKEQVIQELPDKKRERLYVEVDQSYASEINRIQKLTNYIDSEMKNPMKDQEEKRKLSQQREQLLLEYYRVTGLSKIGGIKREVLRLIEAARVQKAIAESALDEAEKEDKDKVKEECAEGIKEPEELLISEETVAKLETRQSSQKKTGKDLISDEDVLVDTDDDIDNNKDEECTWTESASEYEDELKDTDDESDSDLYFNKRKASKSDKDSSKRRKLGEPKRKGKIKASTSSCVDLTGEENVEIQKKDKSKQKKDALAFIQDTFFTVKDEKPKRPKLMLSNKILVFAHHLAVLDAVEDILRESQVGYVRVDGGTTTSKKATLISKFQNDDETDVALLSITACGTGLNLTRANVAVFAEMYWSPGINGQAEDRIHRIGQKSDEVRIIYILARNTADDIVWEQIQKKSSTIGATIGNAERTRYSRSVGGKENQKKQQHTLEKFIGSQASVSSVHDNYQNNNMNTQDVYHNVPTVDLSELTFQQLDNSCQDFILQQALDSANAQNSLEPAIYPTKNYVYDTSYPPPPTSQGISLVSALPSSSNQVYSNCVVLNQEINDDMWESYSAVPHQTITQPPPLPPQIQHQPLMQIPAATTQRRPFSSSSPAQIPKVSTFISSPPPFSPSLSQAPSVSILNHQSVGRPSSLPEEAVARAERNRLEAQRRLALTREREKLERLRQEAL